MSIEVMKQALEALEVATTPLAKDRQEVLRAQAALRHAIEQAERQEPVANDWSVFNTGAEVWSGLSMEDAVAELTPERLERGWSAVCVINKDNPPLYTAPPQRQPDYVWCGCGDGIMPNTGAKCWNCAAAIRARGQQ
jgi:hypothetical protein